MPFLFLCLGSNNSDTDCSFDEGHSQISTMKFLTDNCFVPFRDHLLQSWLVLISQSHTALQMYEKTSFIVSGDLSSFIIDVLDALAEFEITLEPSITRGIVQ